MVRDTRRPGAFFTRHSTACSLSLVGVGSAAGVFASYAAWSQGLKRLGWVLLFAIEAVVFFGIILATEDARRHAA